MDLPLSPRAQSNAAPEHAYTLETWGPWKHLMYHLIYLHLTDTSSGLAAQQANRTVPHEGMC
jgi:hypothetical protein